MKDPAINYSGSEIAIVGVSCRFPGANNPKAYWENLRNGIESIINLKEAELESGGIDQVDINNPNYVMAASILDDIESFDASFFGILPSEAEIMDPQHRLFLECAWEALEDAGIDSRTFEGLIGVYAGARTNTYLLNLFSNREKAKSLGSFEVGLGNDLAFLPTRVSHKLDLKGPSYAVHSACSTSLVSVHLACQSLLLAECDVALAGGVAINIPHRTGYLYQPGGIVSPDGHCKVFDAEAQGTIFGSGIGVVVLKRLLDAISSRDSIYAVIKGSAINNDGALKANFTAPSVHQQSEVILDALANAGVSPETISYIEAHGTGTALGDPIELHALTRAFRSFTSKSGYCAIGSVKSNIGHLDAAAGVAGLIKTVLALKHRQLPPSLHYRQPNPQIDFASSPFYVNSQLREWKVDGGALRAGVSAFGVGGTNAHVILEEAPDVEPSGDSREYQLIVLSARSETALKNVSRNLAQHLRQFPDENLADVAYTLQVGRKRMSGRRIFSCQETEDAVKYLELDDPEKILTTYDSSEGESVVFMFPGGGAQYVNMGLGLYKTEDVFRREVDRGCELLKSGPWYDLRDYLYPKRENLEEARREMKRPSIGLPSLFVIEYAIAKLLEKWGVFPEAMIGHSLGEYVAACLAGVFSLEDVLKIVKLRGELFEESPKGGMVSVWAEEEAVRRIIGDGLSIAAVNGPQHVVVSGKEKAITGLCQRMERTGVEHQRIQIEVAAHSPLIDSILDRYEEYVSKVPKNDPSRKFISNVTGKWINKEEATDARYWRRQLRECVRFKEGVTELVDSGAKVMLEVGPGQTLCSLVNLQKIAGQPKWAIGTIRHPHIEQDDGQYLAEAIGKLWMAGFEINWSGYYEGQRRKRIGLPTYPFERQRYWVESNEAVNNQVHSGTDGKRKDIKEWFYVPGWKRKELHRNLFSGGEEIKGTKYIVMEGESGVSQRLIRRLRELGKIVIAVKAGDEYKRIGEDEYQIRADVKKDYEALMEEMIDEAVDTIEIIHLWSVEDNGNGQEELKPETYFKREQQRGYYSLLYLAQAITTLKISAPIKFSVISNNLHQVSGVEKNQPEKSTMLAFSKVVPQETENITCRVVDIALPPESKAELRLIDRLITEIETDSPERAIAYRGNRRWIQSYESFPLELGEPIRSLRAKGVYLITGGLGGVGMLVAEHLARTAQARLILAGRSSFPSKEGWRRWLASHDEADQTCIKIRRLQAMIDAGAEVDIASIDVGDEAQMRTLVTSIIERYGALNGVLHAAGVTNGPSVFMPFTEITKDEAESQFQAKAYGLYVLENALEGIDVDFCLLFSSNASVLGGLGLVAYSAANSFMDAFAISRSLANRFAWISATWDPWPEETKKYANYQTSLDQYTMTADESINALNRLLTLGPEGQVIVSTGDLPRRLDLWVNRSRAESRADSVNTLAAPEPGVVSKAAPRNQIEKEIFEIWKDVIGHQHIGIHDNFFFDLGGHSLLAIRLMGRLREHFQLDIPLSKFFQYPTISGLAEGMESLRAEIEGQQNLDTLKLSPQLSEEDADQRL